MKTRNKIFYAFLILLAGGLLCGCEKKEVETKTLDVKSISETITTIESDSFDRFAAVDYINSQVSGLTDVYDYDFKKVFGFKANGIEEYSVARNSKTKEVYFIIKATDEQKANVISNIKKYLKKNKLKYVQDEIDSYIVIMATKADNQAIVDEIKKCHEKVFGELMDVDDDMLEQSFSIKKDDVSSYMIKVPTLLTQSSTVVAVKPNKDAKEDVKKALDTYFSNLEEQWKRYLPDQYELVKNRLETEYEGYYIYIVSEHNDAVLDIIKNN